MLERSIRFQSIDGTELEGTLASPSGGRFSQLALLTPGIDVDREEEGFYTQLASRLCDTGIASYRFDWRCHGHDRGRPLSQLTLAGVYNDLDAAFRVATTSVNQRVDIALVAASFSGGVAANWARRNASSLRRVILLAPILDYVHEYVTRADIGASSGLSPEALSMLSKNGFVESWGKRFSQQVINEFFSLEIQLPQRDCYIIHGGVDEGVDIEVPKRFVTQQPNARLLIVEGADHGFCAPGDDTLSTPLTRKLYEIAFTEICMIVGSGNTSGAISDWTPQ
jgi:uncharacterized protein